MREIHFLAVSIADDLDRIFQHRHHSEAQQIHFDDSEIGAIVLVPLHDDAPRHRGRLEWNNAIELAVAHDHATGMLPKMPRQIENFIRQ